MDTGEAIPTTAPASTVVGNEVGAAEVPQLGTPEYDAYMMSKATEAEGVQEVPTEEGSPVDNGLGGFESQEALLKAYQELKAQSEAQSTPTESPNPEDPLAIKQTEETPQQVDLSEISSREQAAEYLQTKNVNLSDIESEYYENGGLSEASYKKLAEAGLPKFLVDNYIQGQQAIAGQMQNEVFGITGGQENYQQVIQWAAKNMSAGEVDAYNSIVGGNNIEATKMAVQGLYARYKASVGENGLIMGGKSSNTGSTYESEAQMVEAMADPRYQKDPAYREAVMRKVLRSHNMRGNW